MFGWGKITKKKCTKEDVRGFLLLCFGREADHASDITRREGASVFGTLRNMLTTKEFIYGVHHPLALNKPLAWMPYSPEQKKIVCKTLKRHLGLKIPLPDHRTKALIQASRSNRFLQAIDASGTNFRASDFAKKIEAHFNQKPAKIIGRIENLQGNTCIGFALDTNRIGESLRLDFYVNGTFVGTDLANGLRRDIEEQFDGFKNTGFSFTLALPAHLAQLDQLILSIFDHATGSPICPSREFPNMGTGYQINILKFTSALQNSKESAPHELAETINRIESALPKLERYAAIPVEAYSQYKTLYKTAKPPAEAVNKIALTFSNHLDLKPVAEAQAWFQHAATNNPEAVIFFSDHETIITDGTIVPIFKSDFDYDELLSRAAYPTAYAVRDKALTGKFSSPHDLWLKVYEKYGAKAFCHVPHILFEAEPNAKPNAVHSVAYTKAVSNHFHRLNIDAKITYEKGDTYSGIAKRCAQIEWPLADKNPMMAIIIPTRDALELTRNCIESLRNTLAHSYDTEIIIVDNGSTDPDTRDWLRHVDGMDGIRVLLHNAPCNWAELNNLAVQATDAEYLLFLNNDTVALDYGWDHILRGYLNRKEIGAVGARLLFEDGTIQFGGYIADTDNIVLKEAYAASPEQSYNQRAQITHKTSALIGAFLACRRDVYEQVGGFDADNFAVAFNDVDFSFALSKAGFYNIYVPAITFSHLESKTRGYDVQHSEKNVREKTERAKMRVKWASELKHDTYYSPSLKANEPTHSFIALK